ncbi:MAG: PqqD family peptide modification chaperone [Pseudomonadota bacterium]
MSLSEIFTLENKELDQLVLIRGEDKISTGLEGETVILDLASGVYSGLDEVGTTIWNLLEQPMSFRDLCQELMAEYAVEEEECRSDLLSFLKDLADNQLITVKNGPTA